MAWPRRYRTASALARQKRIYFSLTRGSDAFIAAEMKQDHAEKSSAWRVDWCGEDGKLCCVSAHTAEDAERKAAAYFSFYPPSTVYSLLEVVERKTTVKRFKATGEVSDTATTGGIEAK